MAYQIKIFPHINLDHGDLGSRDERKVNEWLKTHSDSIEIIDFKAFPVWEYVTANLIFLYKEKT